MKNLCFLLLFIPLSSFAQVLDSVAASNRKEIKFDIDSERRITSFDKTTIEKFKNQDDFNYMEYDERDNFWSRFKKWVGQLWSKAIHWIFGVDKITGFWAVLLRILPYLIIIGVLVLIVWLFMKVNPGDVLLEKNQPPQILISEEEDIIQNQDIEQLIATALKNNNFRLAIRYYYLSTLKKLSENELIDWQAQKTNTDYIYELTGNPLKTQFQKITRLYDFVWYGSFDVEKATFKEAELEFQKISKTINS